MSDGAVRPIVVVGAGFAGLTAANVAAQAGKSVVVLEKGPERTYACNSRIATGVLGLAHTDPMDPPGLLYEAIMVDTEGYARPELARLMAEEAGPALRWLRHEDVKVIKALAANRVRWVLAPPKPPKPGHDWKGRGPDVALQTLTRNLQARGGKVRYETRAKRLRMEGGTCVGIEVSTGGTCETVDASAIILADGGFQANPALMKRFVSPSPVSLAQRNASSGCGDALLMAEEVGAQLTDPEAFYGHLLAGEALSNRELWPYPTLDTLASSAIIVNSEGVRLVDEGLGGITLSNVIARLGNPLSATAIFDEVIWQSAGKAEFIPPNPYVEKLGGAVTRAPTIEVLANTLGIPTQTLISTVQQYNEALRNGRSGNLNPERTHGRAFGESRGSKTRSEPKPLSQPPFYAIRLCAGVSYTLGGIAIDSRCHAMHRSGAPIEGLYAAGSCTGGLEGGPAAGYIGGLLKAICTGFRAGVSASG